MAWWIFQNVVVTAALALAVALVCRVSLFRIGPVARHALWLLVLVKFVTPPLLVWPWAAPDPLACRRGRSGQRIVRTRSRVTCAFCRWSRPWRLRATSSVLSVYPADDAARATGGSIRPAVVAAAAAWPWLLGAWAAGSLFLLGLEGRETLAA